MVGSFEVSMSVLLFHYTPHGGRIVAYIYSSYLLHEKCRAQHAVEDGFLEESDDVIDVWVLGFLYA